MVKVLVAVVLLVLALGLFYVVPELWCVWSRPRATFDYREVCTTPDPFVADLGAPTRELRTTIDALGENEWDRLAFEGEHLDRLPQQREYLLMVWEWHCMGKMRGEVALLAEPDSRKTVLIGQVLMGGYPDVRYPGNQRPDLPCLGSRNPAK